MKDSMKIALLVLAVIYFVSPIDLAPGIVVDDIVVLAAALSPFFKKNAEA